MQFMEEHHYDELITSDTIVLKPDGTPLLIFLKNALDPAKVNLAWEKALKSYSQKTDNRGVASGTHGIYRTKLDGTKSGVHKMPKGWEVVSGTIGFFEREPRRPFCHECAWNMRHPEKFAALLPMVQQVSTLFEQHCPERFAMQKGFVEKTPGNYVIPNTVFTTITINKNFRTACHLDAGDLPEGFTCLSVIERGTYKGANLVLPNYRIAVDVRTNDLIIFDPHEYHGNTQLLPISKGAVRCSLVYYYRKKMVHCLPPEQELERVKTRKPGEPLFPGDT